MECSGWRQCAKLLLSHLSRLNRCCVCWPSDELDKSREFSLWANGVGEGGVDVETVHVAGSGRGGRLHAPGSLTSICVS